MVLLLTSPTLMMMCCIGSSEMMATSSPTPNGQQNCNLYVPVITRSSPGECINLSWQWPKTVKLGILNIPCPPAPDHLRVWMFKVDDLAHLRLFPSHYSCIQYAWALQFTAATTTRLPDCIHEPILYHHRGYVAKPCSHPTFPEALPGVHTSSTSYAVF